MGLLNLFLSWAQSLPSIKVPERQLSLKERMVWTLAVITVYFLLMEVTVIGVKELSSGFDFVQMITASRLGSLLTLGIGPIVIASILIQLLIGAQVLSLNIYDPKDKAKFHELQRIFTIFIALFEGFIFSNTIVARGMVDPIFLPILQSQKDGFLLLLTVQFALGAIIVMYLDEIITKYGIGSGISWFIAQGVSYSVISHLFALFFSPTGILATLSTPQASTIALAFIKALPIFVTLAVFFVSLYGNNVLVKIPLRFGRFRGMSRFFPIPLFYTSNIPVIFGAAFLLQFLFLARALQSFALTSNESYAPIAGVFSDIIYLMTPLHAVSFTDMAAYLTFLTQGKTQFLGIPEWVHAITYVISLTLVSVIFGWLWVEISGMDAKTIADILFTQGISIGGFRANKAIIEKEIAKYLNPIIILGSALVGFIASVADVLGAMGTGTGILLTVMILARMEKDIKEFMTLYFPRLKGVFFGE